jgi:hypothetical protein
MVLSRTQKRNKKNKTERRKKASETRRKKASETRRMQASETMRRHTGSRKIQTAFRDYNQLDKCSICLLGVRPELQEQCHNFHPECIARWKASANANRKLCPSCRQPLLSTKRQQSTRTTQTDLNTLIRNIRFKKDQITVLIDHISHLQPDYFDYSPTLDPLGLDYLIREVMINSNVMIEQASNGTLDARPELADAYLRGGHAHLNEMDDLIEKLKEDLEVFREVHDIRVTR